MFNPIFVSSRFRFSCRVEHYITFEQLWLEMVGREGKERKRSFDYLSIVLAGKKKNGRKIDNRYRRTTGDGGGCCFSVSVGHRVLPPVGHNKTPQGHSDDLATSASQEAERGTFCTKRNLMYRCKNVYARKCIEQKKGRR